MKYFKGFFFVCVNMQIRLDENSKRSHMYYGVSGNDSASGERKVC